METLDKIILDAACEACESDIADYLEGVYNASPSVYDKETLPFSEYKSFLKDERFEISAKVLKESMKEDSVSRDATYSLFVIILLNIQKRRGQIRGLSFENREDGSKEVIVKDISTNQWVLDNRDIFIAENVFFLSYCLSYNHDKNPLLDICNDNDRIILAKTKKQKNYQLFLNVTKEYLCIRGRQSVYSDLDWGSFFTPYLIRPSVTSIDKDRNPVRISDIMISPMITDEANDSSPYSYRNIKELVETVFGTQLMMIVAEWNRKGMNGFKFLRDHPLSTKEAENIVRLAYWEMMGAGISFDTPTDCFIMIQRILSLYREKVFYDICISDSPEMIQKKGKELKKDPVSELIKQLRTENEMLKEKIEKSEKEKSSLSTDIRELRKENYELKKTYEPEVIEEEIFEEEIIEHIKEKEITAEEKEEIFKDYLKNHKVLVWGCRDKISRKISQSFPEIDTTGPIDISTARAERYDLILVRTDFTSHPSYFEVKRSAKIAQTPAYFIDKNTSNMYAIIDAAWNFIMGKEPENGKE